MSTTLTVPYNPIHNTRISDDALVWGFNSPFLWRITQRDITSLYRSNLSRNNHCEIAVGTGLFLTNDMMLSSMNKITLLDLNDNCLRVCEERIKDVCNRTDASSLPAVSKLLVNIMTPTRRTTTTTNDDGNEVIDPTPATPLASMCGKFQSVGANFLFHCLHGSSLYDKIDAFRNCASLLDPIDGVFFGSTILGKEMLDDEMNAGETAMHVLRQFNTVGVFGNMGDSFQDLKDILTETFEDVDLNRIGYCGVWTARHPRI